MANDFKPVTAEDFGLSPEEMQELVSGAQKFLPVGEDPDDNETLPRVDRRN